MLTKIGIIVAMLAIGSAANAAAQGSIAEGNGCKVSNVHTGNDGRAELFLICGDAAYPIGSAISYNGAFNETTNSFVIVRHDQDRTGVTLITLSNDGAPRIDDVSQAVSKSAIKAGLGPKLSYAIDVSGFAGTGAIAIAGGATKSSDAGITSRMIFNLKPYAATAQSH